MSAVSRFPPSRQLAFVRRIVADSWRLQKRVWWYTTMVGKKSTLKACAAFPYNLCLAPGGNRPMTRAPPVCRARRPSWGSFAVREARRRSARRSCRRGKPPGGASRGASPGRRAPPRPRHGAAATRHSHDACSSLPFSAGGGGGAQASCEGGGPSGEGASEAVQQSVDDAAHRARKGSFPPVPAPMRA